jgi:hypothetical protein
VLQCLPCLSEVQTMCVHETAKEIVIRSSRGALVTFSICAGGMLLFLLRGAYHVAAAAAIPCAIRVPNPLSSADLEIAEDVDEVVSM